MHDSLQPKNFLQPNSYKDSRFIAILSLLHGKISRLQLFLRVQKACPSFPTLFPGTWQIPRHLPSGNQPVPAVPGYQLPLCSFNRLRMPCENVRVCLSIGAVCLNIFQSAVLGATHFWCHIRVRSRLGQHPLSPKVKTSHFQFLEQQTPAFSPPRFVFFPPLFPLKKNEYIYHYIAVIEMCISTRQLLFPGCWGGMSY